MNKDIPKTMKEFATSTSTLKPKSYKDFDVGDTIWIAYNEFDGQTLQGGIVQQVAEDHIIVHTNQDLTLWIDKDTLGIFTDDLSAKKWLQLQKSSYF